MSVLLVRAHHVGWKLMYVRVTHRTINLHCLEHFDLHHWYHFTLSVPQVVPP